MMSPGTARKRRPNWRLLDLIRTINLACRSNQTGVLQMDRKAQSSMKTVQTVQQTGRTPSLNGTVEQDKWSTACWKIE